MDELLPVLVARVANSEEAYPVIEAALRHGIAFVKLDEPPSCEGPHVLELHVPQWTEPVIFQAEPAGDALGAEFPIALKPYMDEHVEVLGAILADAGIEVPEPPPPAVEAPVVELDYEEPPPELEELPPEDAPQEQTAAVATALIGRVLGEKYSIDRLLGSGGMGSVYQGTHIALQKQVAIKVLHPSHRHNEEFIAAFHREALSASRLDHPNVVQVLDFGHEKDGLLYIVMELLSGTDLRAKLDREPVQPLDRIVDIMAQVLAALSASHDQNVVHRDVKPENIMFVSKRQDDGTVKDVVKVCDFGIAEFVERDHHGAQGGGGRRDVAGTPDYMSPEQVRGAALDARTDLYSCGVILYEMAAGKVPFHAAETPEEIAWSHVQKDAPPPSSINPAVDRRLESLIAKAMSKDPAARFQTARELRNELRLLLETAKRAALLDNFADDDTALPLGVVPQFERNDAIDVGDLLTLDPLAPAKPGGAKEQIWVLSEQMATALIQDPAAVIRRIEALADDAAYAREMATLERAMASAAGRGAGHPILTAVTHLVARARGVEPGERSREALAAKALRSIARPELLGRLADEALDGAPAVRDQARKALVMLGAAGAHALAGARVRGSSVGAAWPGRPRFVAAVREIGPAAVRPLTSFLEQADRRDALLLEDLLRAIPDIPPARPVHDGGLTRDAAPRSVPGASPIAGVDQLGTLLSSQMLRQEASSVRRAAAVALAAVWGPRANPWLAPLLEDRDDGLCIAAIGALRKHGGVDRETVRRIDRLLPATSGAGTDLRIAAAAALADASGPARPMAIDVLAGHVRPQSGGFLSKLVTAEGPDEPLVIASFAQVLLAIGGPEGARVVEARAAKAGGELKRRLTELLAGRR